MYMYMDVLSIFAKIVVHRHSHIFNMVSKIAANGRVTILLLLLQMKVLYISNILLKFHSYMLNGSGDTLCSNHIPSVFRSP